MACVRTARLWTGCYAREMSEGGVPPIATNAPGQTEGAGPLIEVGGDPFSLTGDGTEEEKEEQAPRSRTRSIVLTSLLAVGLAGAAVLGYVGWKISSQKDATLSTPAEVAGLPSILHLR